MGSAAAQADVLDFAVLDAQQKEQKVCLSQIIYGEKFRSIDFTVRGEEKKMFFI
jgi:hypothetical protein